MCNHLKEKTLFGEIIPLKKISFKITPLFLIFLNAQKCGFTIKEVKNIILNTKVKVYVIITLLETPSLFANIGYAAILNTIDVSDILYNKISFKPSPQDNPKTIGNISKNSNCDFIDRVTNTKQNLTYLYTDVITKLYRLSLDNAKTNSKNYVSL